MKTWFTEDKWAGSLTNIDKMFDLYIVPIMSSNYHVFTGAGSK
jgi:hypothetical protein